MLPQSILTPAMNFALHINQHKSLVCEQKRLPRPTVYDGPILEIEKTAEVTHPEHGNWVFPACIIAVSYQRTVDSEGVQRRAED